MAIKVDGAGGVLIPVGTKKFWHKRVKDIK